ncbi:MAG TPA: arginine repressor [Bacillota bacterium]|nr:arginine repressor [Bacillota bacterium]
MKASRQRKIVEIIRQGKIETQEDIAAALKEAGFRATQATISRDLKELGLVKMPCENNSLRYAIPGERAVARAEKHLKRVFRDSVVGLDSCENLIVVKTNPGEAQGVASAVDHAGWAEIIGTVAGDDTILVVVKPREAAADVMKRFGNLLGG